MKIYKVDCNIRKCQMIQRDNNIELIQFDGNSKIDIWVDTDWYIYNPKDPKSNFYANPATGVVFDGEVYSSDLITLLGMSGEILPAIVEGGEKLYFLNVTNCINVLDKNNTTYHIYPDGTKGRIKDYSFHEKRIGGAPLFKIPETSKSDILCFEGITDSWDEFKGRYDELGFTGLQFTELYDSKNI